MVTIRRQLRWLFAAVAGVAILWPNASTYVRSGQTPVDLWKERPVSLMVHWLGAITISLVLERLTARRLAPFLALLARLSEGQPVTPGELRAGAKAAIAFPGRLFRWWVSGGLIVIALFHLLEWVRQGDGFFDTEQLNMIVRETILIASLGFLVLAIVQRLLRPAVESLGQSDLPEGGFFSIGSRVLLVVVSQAVAFTSFALTTPAGMAPIRMLWMYVPIGLVTVLGAHLAAVDASRNLTAVAGRLRVLAAGLRPDLFHRLAVTGQDEVAQVVAAINALQDRVEREFLAIERDLQSARSVQKSMLPHEWRLPPGWDLAARLIPAQEVGGDFYDVIALADDRIGIAVGDAAGKGLPAALLTASAVSLLRAHATAESRPADVLARVNRLLCPLVPPMTFVTAIYAVVDMRRRTVTMASAGHLPPLVGGREAPVIPALPLGVDPDVEYAEQTLALAPGEPVLFYSDGLVEAHGPGGDLPDAQRLAVLANQRGTPARTMTDALLDEVARHAGGRLSEDDVTALVLVPPVEISWELPSTEASAIVAAQRASRFAAEQGLADRAEAIGSAIGEVVLNAATHGNRMQAELPVSVHLTAGPSGLEATIADRGEPFEPPGQAPDLAAQMAGDGPIRGWGLQIVQATADSFTVESLPIGKQVRLVFKATGESAS